jgi:murein DD-endopeptidase MepM/ murein hydrolase activator NlpD
MSSPPRVILLACLLAALIVAPGPSPASGQESLDDLKERMAQIEADIDAATRRVEDLRTQEDNLRVRQAHVDVRIADLEDRKVALERDVVERAQLIYKSGDTQMLEVLLSSEDVAELAARAHVLDRVADDNARAFVDYIRTESELSELRTELSVRADELASTREALAEESRRLQQQFAKAEDDYESLKKRLAAVAARAARRDEATEPSPSVPAPPSPSPGRHSRPPATSAPSGGGMICPVAGLNSFIDSWGFPRSGGRTHEGTDIMAAFGTPVVAITNGNITYAGYGSSAGNWMILSGSDGNGYWYMHNQDNLVSGGAVSAGQQIATVGNTGNASGGPPHVHFEYHPGGAGPVNPYPLLSRIC